MRQILQNLSSGETRLATVPAPSLASGEVLIRTQCSLISIGTERMMVEFGKANFIDKARQQPEKVKMVLEKVGTDGLAATYEAVKSKLDQPMPLGYSNVGVVLQCGSGVKGFKPGDRVVSNGNHAEVVAVPENLVAAIPDDVSDESATFTVLSAIALQGLRLVAPTLGERIVVIGLGVIGLLTVQLLRAQGCRVLGIEFDESKLALARQFGAETVSLAAGEDPLAKAYSFSGGEGVDAVIITASTKSDEPVSNAARMCRQRGRIVLVGVVGLSLNRSEFYEKELTFQVSCSYGPGRYDPRYEGKGMDYPIGFVRWTENRNFQAVLEMMAEQRLDVAPLLTHQYAFDQAVEAYGLLTSDKNAIGVLLDYRTDEPVDLSMQTVSLPVKSKHASLSQIVCGFIGAGNYASRTLIPAFKSAGVTLDTVVSKGGVSATHHGEKNGFNRVSTDADEVISAESINLVCVVTRHNSHAGYVQQALEAGKHVFVEKPLAMTHQQLADIDKAYQASQSKAAAPVLMVGFNRRFAPQVQKMKSLMNSVSTPKSLIMTMNAGAIEADSWVQDEEVGGGRIIGEACHYIDLMRFLVGAPITKVHAVCMGSHPGVDVTTDKCSITLSFEDGSFGTIHYLANGGKVFPKERIEVFAGNAVLQLDNFRKLQGFGWPGFKKMNLLRQDKGQASCVQTFVAAMTGGSASPIAYEELMEVARISIEAHEQLVSVD
ncbi:bi-domain-containing oxidoreductase [Granulosicoccus antarcticus]|uniref:Alcohol dehydrogenase n=1 Tax=Granulosicoccus antarcticus IMCC3135 TaxID=1192854 RepID=A0A2Z2P0A6_9GAMM|nr:bi-domain-containing oxidoreductase [Granulosicoccus antarcticus]ASJ74550.1 Alcohol dehydrogenase [Granulosicoccus antarcticus IMCC3135]